MEKSAFLFLYSKHQWSRVHICIWLNFLFVVLMKESQGLAHAREAPYHQVIPPASRDFSWTIFGENLTISNIIFEDNLFLIKTPHTDHNRKCNSLPHEEHQIGSCLYSIHLKMSPFPLGSWKSFFFLDIDSLRFISDILTWEVTMSPNISALFPCTFKVLQWAPQ